MTSCLFLQSLVQKLHFNAQADCCHFSLPFVGLFKTVNDNFKEAYKAEKELKEALREIQDIAKTQLLKQKLVFFRLDTVVMASMQILVNLSVALARPNTEDTHILLCRWFKAQTNMLTELKMIPVAVQPALFRAKTMKKLWTKPRINIELLDSILKGQ